MIQFTGLLNNNGTYYKDGYLVLLPHFMPFGETTLDVYIKDLNQKQLGTIGCQTIDKSIFDNLEGNNSYNVIIRALEDFVIDDLGSKNPEVTFTIVPIPTIFG